MTHFRNSPVTKKKKAEGEALRASALKRDVHGLRTARDAVAAKLTANESDLRKTQEAQRAAEAEGFAFQCLPRILWAAYSAMKPKYHLIVTCLE